MKQKKKSSLNKKENQLTLTLKFLKEKKTMILVILVLLLSVFVRFYNFDTRWGIGNDDARDVAIAQEALKRHELPLIGSFSSAGPFVFGPFFYWFIMLCYLIIPGVFVIPWIGNALIGVITVGVMMYCGKRIAGNNFALLVGVFTATSTQLVNRSLILGQHSFIAFTTACTLLSLILFLQKKKLIYAFLVGLGLGAAINFHYQALNLLILLPCLLLIQKVSWKFRIISLVLSFVGVILALFPLLLWDSRQDFASFRNILDYFLIGQYRLYVPNSWKLFLFTYLPNYWGFVLGKYWLVALVTMIISGITILLLFIKKKLPYTVFVLLIPFALLLFLNRFYKGERSEGYLLYFLPFIILFTSYTLFVLFEKGRFVVLRRILSISLFVLIMIGNVHAMAQIFAYKSQVAGIDIVIDKLVKKYPNTKFTIYDYKGSLSHFNQPLSILLSRRGLISEKGMPIGITCYATCTSYPLLIPYAGVYVADLRTVKDIENQNPLWVNVNPQNMYDDLIGWSKRNELRSTFYLDQYLKQKLHF